jgi:deoxycytidylate deaminase
MNHWLQSWYCNLYLLDDKCGQARQECHEAMNGCQIISAGHVIAAGLSNVSWGSDLCQDEVPKRRVGLRSTGQQMW